MNVLTSLNEGLWLYHVAYLHYKIINEPSLWQWVLNWTMSGIPNSQGPHPEEALD